MIVSSVINWLTNAATELNAIVKIHKYKRCHEKHHLILMAMEVHSAFGRDMDHFIRECVHLFHDKQFRDHLSLFFCIKFFKQCISIVLQHALTSKRKIALTGDACSEPPNIIRSHDLHASDIREAMGEIASYHKKD